MIQKSIFFIVVFIFAYSIGLTTIHAEDNVAVILFAKGTVLLNNKTRLKMGDKIGDFDLISTKAKSSCEIQVIKAQTPIVIRMKEDTEFSLSKDLNTNTLNSIVRLGNVLFNVEKLKNDEKINVITPASVTGVRGTKFKVGVDTTGADKIITLEGEVVSRPRISELENIAPEVLKNNSTLDKAIQAISGKNISVDAGTYISFHQDDIQEWIKNSGISEVIRNPDDLEAKEKLNALSKDQEFTKKFEDLLNKGVQVYLDKVENEINEKNLEIYDELIPVSLNNINKEAKFLEALVSRNKERQYIVLNNSLRRDLRYAMAKNADLESQLANANKALEDTNKTELYSLLTQISYLQKEVDTLNAKLSQNKTSQDELKKLQDENDDLQKQNKAVEEKLAAVSKQLEESNKKLEPERALSKKLSDRIIDLEKKLANSDTASGDTKKLADEVQKLAEKKSDLEKKLAEVNKISAELKARNAVLEKEKSILEKKLAESNIALEDSKKPLNVKENPEYKQILEKMLELQKQVEELSKKLTNANKEGEDAKKKVADLEKKNAEISKQLADANKKLADADKTSKDIKAANDAMKKVAQLEKEKSDLEKKLADSNKALEDSKKSPNVKENPEYKVLLEKLIELQRMNENLNKRLEVIEENLKGINKKVGK